MPVAEQRGGSEKYLLEMIRAGRDTEIVWIVILLEDGPMRATITAMGVRVEVIDAKKFSKIGTTLRATLQIKDFCRKNNVRMVIGWMTKGHVYGSISRLLGSPAVPVHFQHGYANPPTGFDKLALHLPVAGVLACSRFVLDSQLALYKNKAPGFVAYPGVAVDEYSPTALPSMEECRAKLGLSANIPLIGTVGRLQHWKGMHTLIDALPAIRAKHEGAQVVLVGGKHDLEPGYEAFLQKRIADAGLQSCVRITGFQSNIAEWIQAMSVFVHASDTEPFGIVVIEAMALGKPVIAGAAGGPREIITENENGLLAAFEDADAVASGVLRYLDDPAWARRVGERARIRAQDFSLTHCAGGVIDAVREISKNKA